MDQDQTKLKDGKNNSDTVQNEMDNSHGSMEKPPPFSMAHALSMIRKRREDELIEKKKEMEEKEKARKEKAREKRKIRRKNLKERKKMIKVEESLPDSKQPE